MSVTASVNSLASAAEIVVPGASSEVEIRWALPITNVTAMVSPSARPRPSMMPPTTPIRVYGRTMLRTTSHVVQPTAYADSLSTDGTISNTSRITAATNGITITARMMPAVSTPRPVGAPSNSGPISHRLPNVAVRNGSTWSAKNGANTNSPHMP